MSYLPFLFIGLSLINIINGNKDTDSGIITIPMPSSLMSPSSGASIKVLKNLPEFFLFRQKTPIDCTDENCFNLNIDKNMTQLSNNYDEPTYGQDYKWDTVDNNEVAQKRTNQKSIMCSCQTKFTVVDFGHRYYPRYLTTAVCQNQIEQNEIGQKCWRDLQCKEVPYRVRLITRRSETESSNGGRLSTSLPEDMRNKWKVEIHTIQVACVSALYTNLTLPY